MDSTECIVVSAKSLYINIMIYFLMQAKSYPIYTLEANHRESRENGVVSQCMKFWY